MKKHIRFANQSLSLLTTWWSVGVWYGGVHEIVVSRCRRSRDPSKFGRRVVRAVRWREDLPLLLRYSRKQALRLHVATQEAGGSRAVGGLMRLPAFVAAAWLGLPSAAAMTTQELATHCAAWVTEDRGPSVEMSKSICVGYMMGITDGHAVAIGIQGGRAIYCSPAAGLPNDKIILAFLMWSLDNRADEQKPARTSVLLALRQAYPCASAAPASPKR